MMVSFNRRTAAAALALAALGGAAACSDTDLPSAARTAQPAVAALRVGLDVSSAAARPGERVAVAVRLDAAGRPVAGLQGALRFDAARLQYVGQLRQGTDILMVNDRAAAQGTLRFAALAQHGALLPNAAVFVFEVRGADYVRGLAYAHEEGVSGAPAELLAPTVDAAVRVAPALAVGLADAGRLSGADWLGLVGEPNAARGIRLRPGEYRPGLVYGDANLSGSITVSDAILVINAAVGLGDLIVGTDAPPVDVVVAGNVFPFNTGSSPARDPGVNPDGSRSLTVSDASVIIAEAVGLDQPVVGTVIPGREATQATNRVVVSGDITSNTTWTRTNVYELQGGVRVTGGATLTIEAGTRVEGQRGSGPGVGGAALFVQRDGRIIADGTYLRPIVFTCTGADKSKGCWGGLVIDGNAPLNEGTQDSPVVAGRAATGGCFTKNGEGSSGNYGGCNPADSSGVLRYVVVEYPGFRFTPENELNGIAFQGVGSGTVVDYVQVHASLDDGMEFFGGTVNVKHYLATGNEDDSFDWVEGFNGKAQFVAIQHDPLDSDKGLEGDNTNTAFDNEPRARPTMYNFTLVGKPDPASTAGVANNNSVGALHIRRGTRPTLRNFLVQNFAFALDIDDASTCTDINSASGFSLKSSIFAANLRLNDQDADPACGPYTGSDVEAQMIQDPANGNSVVATSPLISPLNTVVPDFRPAFGTAGGGATPPSDGFFDPSATYIGAVEPANSSRSNIPWYSGWTRGWQSAGTP